MPTKKSAAKRMPALTENNRCRYERDGTRCAAPRVTGLEYCFEHRATTRESMEQEAVGGPTVAEQLHAELQEERLGRLEAMLGGVVTALTALTEKASAAAAAVPPPAAAGAPKRSAASDDDSELAAQRLALEMKGEVVPRPGRRRELRPSADIPVESLAHEDVVRRFREENERAFSEREARARQRRLRGLPPDEGRYPIEVHLQRSRDTDYSSVVDDKGVNHREEGYVYRHIRGYDLDPDGGRKESHRRLWEFKRNYGAEVVKRPVYDSAGNVTGEEDWVTPLGTLVRYPIEEYAQRVIDNSPYGAFDAALNRQTHDLANLLERENSAVGRREGIAQMVVPEGHGDRSVRLADYE